ncbi:MAG: hypothetical protein JXB23_05845 [Candidatus Aminicenantes bacterium]|nr:hypothetical protein [Candidatus Aminicenantes bacterium]
MMRELLFLFLSLPLTLFSQGYKADSLEVTDTVRRFVENHRISGSDIEIVHKIIEVTHDEFLFIKTDRPRQKKWINDPNSIQEFRNELEKKSQHLNTLNNLRLQRTLTEKEHKERRDLLRQIYFDRHDIQVYENLVRHKNMVAQDMAFVVSGSEAIEHRIRDGCTTMAHLFISLAKAAGIADVRFVVGANVSEFEKACPQNGQARVKEVEIDGHMMALVKIDGRWALVNCTYFEPFSANPETRYEILYELDNLAVSPEMLLGRVIRMPSYQRENFPPSRLLIAGVGKDRDDDLDVENHEALMNLSVSGSPDCPVCKWKLPIGEFGK